MSDFKRQYTTVQFFGLALIFVGACYADHDTPIWAIFGCFAIWQAFTIIAMLELEREIELLQEVNDDQEQEIFLLNHPVKPGCERGAYLYRKKHWGPDENEGDC